MARRSVNVGISQVTTVIFGADSGTLRAKIIYADTPHAFAAVTVNSATDPDTSLDSSDDDTAFLPEDNDSVNFTESAPSGPWEVRLQAINGPVVVQLTDDS